MAAAVSGALDAKSADLRGEALAIFAESNPEAALPKLESVLKNAKAVGETQRAFTTLGAMTDDASKRVLGQWAADLARAPGALKLDIAAAAEKRGLPVEASFDFCLEGGDPRRGKTIMLSHVAAQCTACHKIADGKGSTVGPNLKSVGLRERAYLLESLVNPMAQIAKGYGTISLTLKNGETIAGQFREEKDGKIELRDAEGQTTKIPVAGIAERSPVITTMPPMIAILSKQEIRDVVAFLATLRAEKK